MMTGIKCFEKPCTKCVIPHAQNRLAAAMAVERSFALLDDDTNEGVVVTSIQACDYLRIEDKDRGLVIGSAALQLHDQCDSTY